jgi:N-acetylglucosaminyldiphosphoundecaprenol N-acetyl-beta-D-mannosaminyltransferase
MRPSTLWSSLSIATSVHRRLSCSSVGGRLFVGQPIPQVETNMRAQSNMPSVHSRTARANVLGCEIDRVTLSDALERCERTIAAHGYMQHMAVNSAKLVAMREDRALAEVISRCELVTADGQAVLWASRLLGDPLPERVAGIDLMQGLLERASTYGYRIFILGARQEVLEKAVRHLRDRYPGLMVVGYRDGYFAPEEEPDVVSDIREATPDILFVAMGSPYKELFLGRNGPDLETPFVMGVGGAIDVIAGLTRRAPRLMQKAGLEWLFRLLQEPRRLFRRYATTNSRFIALVVYEALHRCLRPRAGIS